MMMPTVKADFINFYLLNIVKKVNILRHEWEQPWSTICSWVATATVAISQHIVVKNSVQKISDYVLGITLLNQDLIREKTFVTTV
jgi:hypothetical protein